MAAAVAVPSLASRYEEYKGSSQPEKLALTQQSQTDRGQRYCMYALSEGSGTKPSHRRQQGQVEVARAAHRSTDNA